MRYDFLPEGLVLGARLTPQRPPLCPELELLLLSGDVDLEARAPELLALDAAPYWAFCWGSGQALARHVLDHRALVYGRRVVDFGAGSGVAALASAIAGAASVVAVDLDPAALEACKANAARNGLSIECAATVPEDFDVLLASDVLYEAESRARLLAWSAAGKRVIVADPLRPGNARLGLAPTARYEARTLPDVDRPIREALVYELEPGASAGLSPLKAP